MSADTIELAREELRRGIAATIRLWAEARAKYDDARDVDNEAHESLVALQLVDSSLEMALEAELHKPDDGDGTVARLERVTRNGGHADG